MLMQQPLSITMLLPNGTTEMAEDTGGVLRDALSEYWETFFMKCGTDGDVQVPVLRHDLKDTWEQCAVVLVLGYKLQGYLPTALAPPFLQHCLGIIPSRDDVVESFMQMIPCDERKLAELPNFEDDDFMEFLVTHDVRKVVTADNWPKVLYEVAHKMIIQEPAFVRDIWSPILKEHLTLDVCQLKQLLSGMQPTPKNIMKILSVDEEHSSNPTVGFLKKFVKNSNMERCRRFLRFCTGMLM